MKMCIIQMKSFISHIFAIYLQKFIIIYIVFANIAFLSFDRDLRSKVMAPNESTYMISYMYIIQMKSLFLIVSKILMKIAF